MLFFFERKKEKKDHKLGPRYGGDFFLHFYASFTLWPVAFCIFISLKKIHLWRVKGHYIVYEQQLGNCKCPVELTFLRLYGNSQLYRFYYYDVLYAWRLLL